MARDEALNDAVDSVAEDLGMTRDELLSAIGVTEETLGAQITDLQSEFRTQLTETRSDILNLMQENEAAGMARDEALGDITKLRVLLKQMIMSVLQLHSK